MQPKTQVKMDAKSFEILKKTIRNISSANRGSQRSESFHTDMPAMVGLKLTNRCNLRCKHCYEWSEHGYCQDMDTIQQNDELPLPTLTKIIEETREANSALYIWGGEPLIYQEFDTLARLIEGENRICAICTNGLLLEDRLDSILRMGPNVEIVLALEGLEEKNDSVRGKGVYQKALKAIQALLDSRKAGRFQGKITIHTVIHEDCCEHLWEYVRAVEEMEVDSLILCFPWYISESSSQKMKQILQTDFSWLPGGVPTEPFSWDSFRYGLSPACAPIIIDQLNQIISTEWKYKVRYFPEIRPEEMVDFLSGHSNAAQNRTHCNAIATRMDVMPDGSVSSCKHFREFTVGNLNTASVSELWNSEQFNRMRAMMAEKLMPVCAQCNNLYLHGE